MSMYEILGYIGIPIVESSGVYQIILSIKRKKCEDVSLMYFLSVFVGAGLLLVHFIAIMDWVGILSNGFCVLITSVNLFLILKYRRMI